LTSARPGNPLNTLVFEPITPLRQGFRDSDVDLAEISDQDPGDLLIGWIEAGEWVRYTVNVAETGEVLGRNIARTKHFVSAYSLKWSVWTILSEIFWLTSRQNI